VPVVGGQREVIEEGNKINKYLVNRGDKNFTATAGLPVTWGGQSK